MKGNLEYLQSRTRCLTLVTLPETFLWKDAARATTVLPVLSTSALRCVEVALEQRQHL